MFAKMNYLCMALQIALELKKDPGIPNLYPFKDQLLREIEERKQRVLTIFTLCNC